MNAIISCGGTPGKLKVSIDGNPATTNFGTEGPGWHWQEDRYDLGQLIE